jgi:hypothetical protein
MRDSRLLDVLPDNVMLVGKNSLRLILTKKLQMACINLRKMFEDT